LLAGIGILIGTALALFVTRPLAGLVVGVNVRDPIIFTTVAIGLTVLALGSAFIPARRASRIDPVRALREEA
jgi:ABC-type antimicrobial peptide transport system permease subunit